MSCIRAPRLSGTRIWGGGGDGPGSGKESRGYEDMNARSDKEWVLMGETRLEGKVDVQVADSARSQHRAT